ncbi:MAG TPA: GNAT family N-acetyltransferase [Acidimicrobiia bacterium]|nr:GNAT family N-acetyltransferase [Acidimicrobiia bacterium]
MRMLLASVSLSAVPGVFAEWGAPRRVAFVPTAADELPERDAMMRSMVRAFTDLGCEVDVVDLDESADPASVCARLAAAEVIAVGGGDPYRLAARVRATGASSVIADAVTRGVPYVGLSAGAMLVGPTLEPLRFTSPFPAPDPPPCALGLFARLVLPHDDRPGRRAHHDAARAAHPDVPMVALRDDEALVVHDRHLEVRAGKDARDPDVAGVVLRDGAITDAPEIAAVFTAAARAAWSDFLGEERLAAFESPAAQWEQRIADLTAPARLRVAIDDQGVVGFAWIGPAPDLDVAPGTGQLDLFYTHPRCWGTGIGRSLHRWALSALASAGFARAVLWTEARNERPLRIYVAAGWTLDGAVREREFLGVGIRELRHQRVVEA